MAPQLDDEAVRELSVMSRNSIRFARSSVEGPQESEPGFLAPEGTR